MPQTLYGAKGGSSASDLFTIDPATGVATSIGPTGIAPTGLAFDPTTGLLYAASSNQSPGSPRSLYTVDPATGVATLVSQFTLSGVPLGNGHPVADICFDAGGQLYGWVEHEDSFAIIDKATGAVTIPSSSGLSTYGDGMDVDPQSGALYVCPVGGPCGNTPPPSFGDCGSYYTVDPVTGVLTVQPSFLTGGLVSDGPAVGCLSFDNSGLGWAFLNDFPDCYLVTIDPVGGAVTDIAGLLPDTGWDALAWGTLVAPGPFTLHATPGTITVVPGGSGTSTITSTLNSGSPETVALSITSTLPTGVTATLTPGSISSDGGLSTLHVTTTGATPLGSFGIVVHGDDGNGNTDDKTVAVHVITSPPAVVNIAS
jgi:hypothetical protein